MALILQGCGEINELVFVRGLVGTWPYIVLVTCEIMWPCCSSGLTISAPSSFAHKTSEAFWEVGLEAGGSGRGWPQKMVGYASGEIFMSTICPQPLTHWIQQTKLGCS